MAEFSGEKKYVFVLIFLSPRFPIENRYAKAKSARDDGLQEKHFLLERKTSAQSHFKLHKIRRHKNRKTLKRRSRDHEQRQEKINIFYSP